MDGNSRSRLSWVKMAFLTATLAVVANLTEAAVFEGSECNEDGFCAPKINLRVLTIRGTLIVPIDEDVLTNTLVGLMTVAPPTRGKAGSVVCQSNNPVIDLKAETPKVFMMNLAQTLDREKEAEINITINCFISEDPALSTLIKFNLQLNDVNDNAPQFTNDPSVKVELPENVEVGHFVTRVSAVDLDEGKNGEIAYFIPTEAALEAINKQKEYESSLKEDFKGEYPVLDGFPLPPGDLDYPDGIPYLPEEEDLEEYHTAEEAHSEHMPFRIDQNTGDIFTTGVIDRETTQEFHVPIAAEDLGEEPQLTLTWLRVVITDVNDNSPILLTRELHAKENQQAKTKIGQLRATDLDEGRNAEIMFSKLDTSDGEDESDSPFLVRKDGRVLAKHSLDREKTDRYILAVTIRDKGKPKLTTTATVLIHVDDVNDNSPVLTSRCLGDSADDDYGDDEYDDKDDYKDVLADEGDDKYDVGVFNAEEGDRVTHFFDRTEYVESTTDSGIVSNTNNKKPARRLKSGEILIDWGTPEGQRPAYTVTASDGDSGENAKVYFSMTTITSGGVNLLDSSNASNNGYDTRKGGKNYGNVLDINPISGEIYLRRYLLASDPLSQLLKVTVRDGGSPSLSAQCLLNVTFDINVTMMTPPPPSTTESATFNSTDGASSKLGPECAMTSTSLFCAIAIIKYIVSVAAEYDLL